MEAVGRQVPVITPVEIKSMSTKQAQLYQFLKYVNEIEVSPDVLRTVLTTAKQQLTDTPKNSEKSTTNLIFLNFPEISTLLLPISTAESDMKKSVTKFEFVSDNNLSFGEANQHKPQTHAKTPKQRKQAHVPVAPTNQPNEFLLLAREVEKLPIHAYTPTNTIPAEWSALYTEIGKILSPKQDAAETPTV
jgi:hypothetical protein